MPSPARALVVLVAALAASHAPAAEPAAPGSDAFVADFDELWTTLRDGYAYLDRKSVDWERVRELHRPRAQAARTREDFVAVLEGVLEELYDPHATLGTNTPSSPRLVPSGTDLWAEWIDGRAVLVEVRPGSDADSAGLRAGMTIRAVNGTSIEAAVLGRVGRALRRPDPAARDWALRAVLAGRHDEERRLKVAEVEHEVRLPRERAERRGSPGRLQATRLPSGHGLIRLANSLGDQGLIADFDAALDQLRDCPGLVLDLRDTPSGGNTTVARAILGRFIDTEKPYQKHGLPAEKRRYGVERSWLELVSPRAPRYRAPVAVLVSHWTGSMGEGLAVGMDALGAGAVVGTRMAGLLGATYRFRLSRTGIPVDAPGETLFHVNGTPREDFRPAVLVDLAKAQAAEGSDAILEAGLAVLREKQP